MAHDPGARFRKLHRPGDPFFLANARDAGSARVLAALGAAALGTTSAGLAFTLGRTDLGRVTRDGALAHAESLVAATPLPVSTDLESWIRPRARGRGRDRAPGRRGSARLLHRGHRPAGNRRSALARMTHHVLLEAARAMFSDGAFDSFPGASGSEIDDLLSRGARRDGA